MNPLTEAVLKAGLVSPSMLREMKRISPVIDPEAEAEEPKSLEEAVKLIDDALQSEQYVLVRETDLEVVRQYADTVRTTVLHVEVEDGTESDMDVTYGKTPLGEFIIAWKSESIRDMMTNGLTYLVENGTHVFFKDVRELFFGEQKAFMVCVPSTVEHADHA
jgi:hypothetical protein